VEIVASEMMMLGERRDNNGQQSMTDPLQINDVPTEEEYSF
jgi:hypothetical protein